MMLQNDSSFISSIDGSIRESPSSNYRGNGPTSSAQNDTISANNISYNKKKVDIDAFQLESCRKISELLNDLGYSSMFIESAEEYEFKSFPRGERFIPFSVLHSWSSVVLKALTEILERLSRQSDKIQSASLSMQFVEVSKESLHQQLEELEKKLIDSDRVTRNCRQKITSLEEANDALTKTNKTITLDMKKAIKNLEQQIQESERRGRQKEIEINRLKSKLSKVAEKEKEAATRNKAIVAELAATASCMPLSPSVRAASPPHTNSRQARIDDHSSPTTTIHRAGAKNAVTWQSTRGKSPASITRQTHNSSFSSFNSSSSSNISVDAAVEAFSYERKIQQSRIAELETQVRSLERSVADAQNLVVKSETRSSDQEDSWHAEGEKSAGERSTLASSSTTTSSSNELTPTARSMFEKINAQAESIVKLTQQLEAAQTDSAEKDKELEQCRSRCSELKEGWENMKLEIESRPTARQWSDTRRELQELEDKMHDLVMMRGEASELAMWRKHLSTSERIRIDKKNHELGLYLIDALPKQVMKEVLQSVCRDLDITDVSEIPICLSKLKMVVKTVPRMERLIAQVSEYLFERESHLLLAHAHTDKQDQHHRKDSRFTIDDIPKVLSRWWQRIERVEELSAFNAAILRELQRHSTARTNKKKDDPNDEDGNAGPEEGGISPHLQDPLRACAVIRSLVDFHAEVLSDEDSMRSVISFIKDRPDLAVNRIVGHILFVFDIKSVDGILPRMNQLYLFSEEMKNFMAAMRALLGAQNKPSAVVIDEIQRRVAITMNAINSST